ncbi:ribonuclease Z [Salimicrobium humidisoli]|uniref:Ribonuclease Z n=1 Tax=Salimicrobium humidisoli TaxID=2029857 RepID=A0ABX4HPD1_9BACI|nr:ribonuclease Z [Salimicrobium humidisoli]PBB05046.1 ribonuclease Z [Salimicrobium humidisoli]
MELYFLGTGSGVPSKERNVSSLVLRLIEETGKSWMFDCGEGTQHQILDSPVKARRIEKVFITHLHGDHIYGLPGFLSSRSFQGGTEPLTVYGPEGLQEFVESALRISGTHLTYDLHFRTIEDGFSEENEQFEISAHLLEHGLPSYGFFIKEKPKPGALQKEKLEAMGIRPGPVYQTIKNQETTVLEDGTVIKRSDVLSAPKPGRSVAILGDTRFRERHTEWIKGADVLIHEGTFEGKESRMAYDYYHSTVVQAAETAAQSGVDTLYVNHLSSRYQREDIARLLAEAREVFPDTFIVHDHFHTSVVRKERQ